MKRKGAKLGQHFLHAPWVVSAMCDAAHVNEESVALEIGPGTGMLTKKLLEKAKRVVAVEKDPELVAQLRETFREQIDSGKLLLIENDIRNVSPSSLGLPQEYVVAANIPYYITGEIIRTLLTSERQPKTIALLIQKEVAQRIVAQDKKESILSLSVKAYGVPRLVRSVPRGCFRPAPTVDSAILSIDDVSRDTFATVNEERFFEIVHAGFASKRKMLAGNLRAIAPTDVIATAFNSCDIEPNTRAEDVPISRWMCLVKELQ